METLPIRVAIADDHVLLRQTLVRTLSVNCEFQFVIEVNNGMELLTQMRIVLPEVVILDIHMPKMNGIQALKVIRERYPEIRVLMLSAFVDTVFIRQCLEFGVNGYLTKDMEVAEIASAIRAAHCNEVYRSFSISNGLLKNYSAKFGKADPDAMPMFSQQEVYILELLRDEVPTAEISKKMCLSKRSIELKRDKMKEKANARTIAGLILYALKRGLLSYAQQTRASHDARDNQ